MTEQSVIEVPYGQSDELRLVATLTSDGRPVLKQTNDSSEVTSLTNAIGAPLVARVRAALGLSEEDGPVWLYKLGPTLHKNIWWYDAASDDFAELDSWKSDQGLVDAVDRLLMNP